MDIISRVELKTEKNERTYHLILPAGAPYGEVCDVLFEAMGKIAEMMKESASRINPTKNQTPSDPVQDQEPQGE